LTTSAWGAAGSKDPDYDKPYVDVDEWRDAPVRHRYVHGGFEDTDLRFSFYFPPAERYEGRFFQPLMFMSGTEHAAGAGFLVGMGASIDFAVDNGAYLVESNLGRLNPFPGTDGTVPGFRASAAAARYSRVLAAEMYGDHRPYGYCYGGSGGGFKTIACLENTSDVWDGGIPFVIGSPQALPNVFSVQAHALRILWHKFPQIVDAIEPGGSGDMFAGLSAEEREALAEATAMGFPPRAWFHYERFARSYTSVWAAWADNMMRLDPTYFEEFWTVPGYLGANPTESLTRARVQHKTTITKPIMGDEAADLALPLPLAMPRGVPVSDIVAAVKIDDLPDGDIRGAMLTFTSGSASGCNLWIVGLQGDIVLTGVGEKYFEGLGGVKPGDEVVIDNSPYLAFQTYHRHQVSPDYPVWDYFCIDGKPIYPQRPMLLGGPMSKPGTGTVQTGRFSAKMIVVETLMDDAAYPWQAAWYADLIRQAQGAEADERFRLYFVDHAMHMAPMDMPGDPRPVGSTRFLSYAGVLQQALLDLAAWAEQDIAPPASTVYDVVDGQVHVPAGAADRKGLQPTVDLTVDGRARVDISVGESVDFVASIDVPPGTGNVVAAEWDFDGSGEFAVKDPKIDGAQTRWRARVSHTFAEPGTYFPTVRVFSHRRGDIRGSHALVPNLARVRVVVT
jgi:hypothetical protein